jgi:hypothetical protein
VICLQKNLVLSCLLCPEPIINKKMFLFCFVTYDREKTRKISKKFHLKICTQQTRKYQNSNKKKYTNQKAIHGEKDSQFIFGIYQKATAIDIRAVDFLDFLRQFQ